MRYLVTLCLTSMALSISAQHNFKMGPQTTTCNSLDGKAVSIEQIEEATFRLVEQLKISRYHTPAAATYYSCDGLTGYLVVLNAKGIKTVYHEVPTAIWKRFNTHVDPVGYYRDSIATRYD